MGLRLGDKAVAKSERSFCPKRYHSTLLRKQSSAFFTCGVKFVRHRVNLSRLVSNKIYRPGFIFYREDSVADVCLKYFRGEEKVTAAA